MATILKDANTLYLYRGQPRKRTLYTDADGSLRASIDWTGWLGTSTIATSTWSTEDDETWLTLTSDDNDTVATEVYVSSQDRSDRGHYIENKVITDTPETFVQSIRVITARIS